MAFFCIFDCSQSKISACRPSVKRADATTVRRPLYSAAARCAYPRCLLRAVFVSCRPQRKAGGRCDSSSSVVLRSCKVRLQTAEYGRDKTSASAVVHLSHPYKCWPAPRYDKASAMCRCSYKSYLQTAEYSVQSLCPAPYSVKRADTTTVRRSLYSAAARCAYKLRNTVAIKHQLLPLSISRIRKTAGQLRADLLSCLPPPKLAYAQAVSALVIPAG